MENILINKIKNTKKKIICKLSKKSLENYYYNEIYHFFFNNDILSERLLYDKENHKT